MATPKISLKEIEGAIEKSGYLFEQKQIPIFEKFGYLVEPNKNFKDQDSGISREIDIHCLKCGIVSSREMDFIFPVLLVECKNYRNPIVFFTRERIYVGEYAVTNMDDIYLSGFPYEVKINNETNSLSSYLKMYKYHHYYLIKEAASQFCTFKYNKREKQWIATHEDFYEDAVLKLIKALIYENNEHKKSGEYNSLNLQIYYPIIISSSDIYKINIHKKKPKLEKTNHVLLIRNYHSSIIQGEFFIDIINVKFLSRFLGIIDKELDGIVRRVKRNIKILRKSIKRKSQSRR